MNDKVRKVKRFFQKYKIHTALSGILIIGYLVIQLGLNTGTPNELRIKNFNEVLSKDIKTVNLNYNGSDRSKVLVSYKDKEDRTHKGYFPASLLTVATDNNYLSKLEENKKEVVWGQVNDSPVWGMLKVFLIVVLSSIIGYFLYIQLKLMTGMVSDKKPFEIKKPEDLSMNRKDLIGLDYVNEEIDLIVEQYKIKEEMLKRRKEETKKEYKERIESLQSFLNKPFNMILSGPPGVGKTQIAGVIAKDLNLPIIMTSASNLESGIVGGGSRMLQDIVSKAKKFDRVIIFLDEAQTLFKKRGQSNGDFADDTANTFLSILEGVNSREDTEIIWICASNFNQENMKQDEAMLRRFPIKIDFRLPNIEERIEIFKHYLSKVNNDRKGNIDYNYLGSISANLSPALIKNIIERSITISYTKDRLIDTDLLFESFEVMTIGKMNRETTKDMLRTREFIVIHELGHFVSALSEKLFHLHGIHKISEAKKEHLENALNNINTLKISTEAIARNNALGYVLSKEDKEMLKTKEDLESIIVSLYAGQAAEKEFFNTATTGSVNDIQKASYYLKVLVREANLYSDFKINTEILENKVIEKELSEIEKDISKRLFNRSLMTIQQNKEIIKLLKPILLKEYVLDISRVKDILLQDRD